MSLPESVLVGPGVFVPVIQKPLDGRLGYFTPKEIAIEQNQSEAGKHSILLHEMMHAAAEKLKLAGLVKRHPSEAFIENMAGVLFLMLAGSGLWNGITKEEAMQFAGEESAD